MSWFQRLFSRSTPARAYESMKRESQEWMIRCKACGHERSVWASGGVRWGAAGEPTKYMRCSECDRWRWHKIYRKSS